MPDHTCTNTATTVDGSMPPPCPGCMARIIGNIFDFATQEAKALCEKLYQKRETEALEPALSRHMLALTMGTMRDDDAIAEQLAWRDQRIAQLEAEREHLLEAARLLKTSPRVEDIDKHARWAAAVYEWLAADAARRAK